MLAREAKREAKRRGLVERMSERRSVPKREFGLVKAAVGFGLVLLKTEQSEVCMPAWHKFGKLQSLTSLSDRCFVVGLRQVTIHATIRFWHELLMLLRPLIFGSASEGTHLCRWRCLFIRI